MEKKKRLVCGVGINDADYNVYRTSSKMVDGKRIKKVDWVCPIYLTWKDMITRCYSDKFQSKPKNTTYKGCTVCDEWLRFSNFRAWMIQQDYRGKDLDKDLLIKGNKVYSPTTCVFVSKMVNLFMMGCDAKRGKHLIGVHWNKAAGKFVAQCSNPFLNKVEHLGCFDNEKEAHEAWRTKKHELAIRYASKQDDPRLVKALLERYSNPNE